MDINAAIAANDYDAFAAAVIAKADVIGARVAAETGVGYEGARVIEENDEEFDTVCFLTFATDDLSDAAYDRFADWLAANVPGFVELDDDMAEVNVAR